jgi:hypothetical protein
MARSESRPPLRRPAKGRDNDRRAKAKAKSPRPSPPPVRKVTLPIVGEVAMIPEQRGEGTVWWYDPDLLPPIPKGAIRGDIRRQRFCCDAPRYAYMDDDRTCVQCSEQFTFGAAEQKYWYETLQFDLSSTAIRCVGCRRKRRSEASVRRRYNAVVAFRSSDNARELIEFATATIELFERVGAGNLDHAMAACRKAFRVEPAWADPLYWQGRVHELAQRPERAEICYAEFLSLRASHAATRRHLDDATRRVDAKHSGRSLPGS